MKKETKNIVLGITGSIAAYKIPELIRLLIKDNVGITTILTKNARYFITPTVLGALTGKMPLDEDQVFASPHAPHLSIVPEPSIMVIAPATANIIAKCAHGIADDYLSTAFLSFPGTKLIVPAMHTEMYESPATQDNINLLKKRGVYLLGPDAGSLACGDNGRGRMVSIDLIKLKIESLFLNQLPLGGQNILITAGGTSERLDNVRTLTNEASGKLGMTLAHLASFMGAKVTLISTVYAMPNPHLKKVIYVKSSEDMHKAVLKELSQCDRLYMTAAVSDFTCNTSTQKIKRKDRLELKLKATPDILQDVAKKKKNQNSYHHSLLKFHNRI